VKYDPRKRPRRKSCASAVRVGDVQIFLVLICISELGLECGVAGCWPLSLYAYSAGRNTMKHETCRPVSRLWLLMNDSGVYIVEMTDLMLRGLSTKQGSSEGYIARCHGHSCRLGAVQFCRGPKATWLLNCALASVTAKTSSQRCGLCSDRGGSRNEGSESNEICKAVCIVLTRELTFGVILGKLKQE